MYKNVQNFTKKIVFIKGNYKTFIFMGKLAWDKRSWGRQEQDKQKLYKQVSSKLALGKLAWGKLVYRQVCIPTSV